MYAAKSLILLVPRSSWFVWKCLGSGLQDASRRFKTVWDVEFFSKRLPEAYEKLQDGSNALPRPSNAARMAPPRRLKTVLGASKTLISLQTSFKNELWQRLQRRLCFKGVLRCFWDASRRLQGGSNTFQDAFRTFQDVSEMPSGGIKTLPRHCLELL